MYTELLAPPHAASDWRAAMLRNNGNAAETRLDLDTARRRRVAMVGGHYQSLARVSKE